MTAVPTARRPGPARARLLLVVALAASPAGASAAAGPAVLRAEAASGYDSNVTRVEGAPGQGARRSGGVLRAVLDLQDAARPGAGVALSGAYHLGAKHFFEHDGEDTLLQRVDGALMVALAVPVRLRADAWFKDRTSRRPERPRNFTVFGAGPGVELRLGELRVEARAFAERFLYRPADELSSRALGATLRVSHPVGAMTAHVSGALTRREFDGDRWIEAGGEGLVVALDPGRPRRDDVRRVAAGLGHVGDWIGRLEYAYEVDASNSHGAGFRRHVVTGALHVPLPLDLIASLQASLQHIAHDDRQHLAPSLFVEDEDRTAFTLRIDRPLAGGLALVAHGGLQLSPAGAGPDYDRQTVLLGVAWNTEQ